MFHHCISIMSETEKMLLARIKCYENEIERLRSGLNTMSCLSFFEWEKAEVVTKSFNDTATTILYPNTIVED